MMMNLQQGHGNVIVKHSFYNTDIAGLNTTLNRQQRHSNVKHSFYNTDIAGLNTTLNLQQGHSNVIVKHSFYNTDIAGLNTTLTKCALCNSVMLNTAVILMKDVGNCCSDTITEALLQYTEMS